MSLDDILVRITRGAFEESVHRGAAVVCGPDGDILESWGDPQRVVLPRSSAKMLQALPLVESGAADALGLGEEQLALACASHNGGAMHTDRVRAWLDALGLGDDDLRCGGHMPRDEVAARELTCSGASPCQVHNNCSGKHAGFLTLTRQLRAGPEYVDPDHPVQRAVREAFEDMTGAESPGFGIDGCSAPNFATTLQGMARAMARMATAATRDGARDRAGDRLVRAMMAHPELVAGEGRACTDLMRAAAGMAAVKTGAEGVFVGILPQQGIGIALKITDGGTRAAECAMAALLVRHGVVEAGDKRVAKWLNPDIVNWRGIVTGRMEPDAVLRS